MTIHDWLVPLGLAVVGWFLNEFAHARRASAAARAVIGRVIADLLEMRLTLRAADLSIRELKKIIRVSDEEIAPAMPFLKGLIPTDATLPNRLRDAFTILAEHHPVLAFRLRGKENGQELFRQMRDQLSSLGGTQQLAEMERFLSSSFLVLIDELLTELARAHGVTTWWEVRRVLRSEVKLPPGLKDLILNGAPPDRRIAGD